MNRTTARSLMALGLAMAFVVPAGAQPATRAGIVTNLEGRATVARTAVPQAAPLRLRDDVFLRDRIATAEESRARLLLGGKAVVTVREQSVFTIRETPDTSTIEISSGKLSLSVARERLRPGERIEVRTPNAITAVRGTVLITEVSSTPAGVRSRFTLLKGLVDVAVVDPATGRATGAPVTLSRLQRTVVNGFAPPTAPQAVSASEGDQMAAEYTFDLGRPSVSQDVLDRQLQQGIAAAGAVAPNSAADVARTAAQPTGPRVSGDDLRLRAGTNMFTPAPARTSPTEGPSGEEAPPPILVDTPGARPSAPAPVAAVPTPPTAPPAASPTPVTPPTVTAPPAATPPPSPPPPATVTPPAPPSTAPPIVGVPPAPPSTPPTVPPPSVGVPPAPPSTPPPTAGVPPTPPSTPPVQPVPPTPPVATPPVEGVIPPEVIPPPNRRRVVAPPPTPALGVRARGVPSAPPLGPPTQQKPR